MEPNKLETQIKEQLNAREIKPTEMAWDRLDAMLSVAEEKTNKKRINWFLIAACFIGLLCVGTLIYQANNNDITIENEVVTNENNTKNDCEIVNEDNPKPLPNKQDIKVASAAFEKINSNTNPKPSNRNQSNNNTNQIINQKETVNPNLNLDKEIQFQNQEVIGQVNSPSIDTKTKTVTPKPQYVTADELLASVDKARKSVKQTSVKVNANSLLSKVDGELNQDFRETRFQKIKRNFETVKVAVYNRNSQE